METNILGKLSQDLQVAPGLIIREYWEMILLKELSQSSLGPALIFKGGTALRLGYNSPRFSEDLDFDLVKKINYSDFKKLITAVANKYPEASVKDMADKYNTLIAQILLKDVNWLRNFSIKIEISKRDLRDKKYYEPRLLLSPVSSIQVLANIAKLENIRKEKVKAIKTRKQARDIFDLWYIAQTKREPWRCPEHSISAQEIKRELNKFLPRNYQKVLDELICEKAYEK